MAELLINRISHYLLQVERHSRLQAYASLCNKSIHILLHPLRPLQIHVVLVSTTPHLKRQALIVLFAQQNHLPGISGNGRLRYIRVVDNHGATDGPAP